MVTTRITVHGVHAMQQLQRTGRHHAGYVCKPMLGKLDQPLLQICFDCWFRVTTVLVTPDSLQVGDMACETLLAQPGPGPSPSSGPSLWAMQQCECSWAYGSVSHGCSCASGTAKGQHRIIVVSLCSICMCHLCLVVKAGN